MKGGTFGSFEAKLLGPARCTPFRAISFLIRGDFLIRSLPLPVLTLVDCLDNFISN